LDQALKDCNESLRLRPNDANTLDSRGLVYLKLSNLDKAIDDYDAVVKLNPKAAGSLYGRGIAKQKKGDRAGGKADIVAAKAARPEIAELFVRYGVATVDGISAPVPTSTPTAVHTSSPTQVPATDCAQAETHWKSAEDIKTLSVYQDHLARFPTCNFSALARARIEALKK
jgi:tetratricopeptide (TPR) repeat protein